MLLFEFEVGYYQPWSVNELTNTPRGNAIRSKQKKWWRDAATSAAFEHMAQRRRLAGTMERAYLPPSTVQVAIPFKTSKTRRDPHNYVGTVVKSIVDGLVRANVWPDDDPRYVTVIEPILYKGTTVQIKIEPRET